MGWKRLLHFVEKPADKFLFREPSKMTLFGLIIARTSDETEQKFRIFLSLLDEKFWKDGMYSDLFREFSDA